MSRTLSSILNQAELVPPTDANDIPYVPFGDLQSSNVQGAIDELDAEKQPLIPTSTTDKFYRGDKSFELITTLNVHVAPERRIGNPTFVDTQSEINNYIWSAGILNGCNLINNGNSTVSFTSGSAVLRSTSSHTGTMYAIEVQAQSDLNLLDNTTNYVYLDYNSGVPVFKTSSSQDSFNCLDKCLAYLIHRQGIQLNIVDVREQNLDTGTKTRRLFLDFSKFIPASAGSTLGSHSGTTLSVTEGRFYFMVTDIAHPAFDTSIAGTANENNFKLWYRNAGNWTDVANQKSIDTSVYDNNTGTPVTLPNNSFGVSWIYIVHNTPSSLHVVMGQQSYANLASAVAATPPSSVPNIISGMGSIIGKVVYAKANTTFDAIYSALTTPFGSSAATIHNGLSGIQGGAVNEYYHLTSAEYARTVAQFNTRLVTANTTVTLTDGTIRVDTSAGDVTVTLPAASTVTGYVFIIKKVDSTLSIVTLVPNASEVIDGQNTISIYSQYDAVTIQSNGTSWDVI